MGVPIFNVVDSSFARIRLTSARNGRFGRQILETGRGAFLFFQFTLVLSLINADRLIQKERESGGSSDIGNCVLDSGLETLMEQKTLGIVIEFEWIYEGLEFDSVCGSRFGLDKVREFILIPCSQVAIRIQITESGLERGVILMV